MLHLIWSKDTSTIEEGREVKSVRKKLIESYKQLYFEPLSDLSPKDNVNRIARNMIECVATCHALFAEGLLTYMTYRLTFNATLAEITSLEELLSVIMTEDAIHEDVINKLWQVYSKLCLCQLSISASHRPPLRRHTQGYLEGAETRCHHRAGHARHHAA